VKTIRLDDANRIIGAVFAKGAEMGLKPLCAVVLDTGGHVVAIQRQDQASTLRPQIAIAKASGALGLGVSSRKIAEMAAERPTFLASLASLAPQGIIPAAGGVIVMRDGEILGAVGVTGDTSDKDEECALAGIAAADLLVVA
jgi:uncharacterized protein GlcG (DUF336 family)